MLITLSHIIFYDDQFLYSKQIIANIDMIHTTCLIIPSKFILMYCLFTIIPWRYICWRRHICIRNIRYALQCFVLNQLHTCFPNSAFSFCCCLPMWLENTSYLTQKELSILVIQICQLRSIPFWNITSRSYVSI